MLNEFHQFSTDMKCTMLNQLLKLGESEGKEGSWHTREPPLLSRGGRPSEEEEGENKNKRRKDGGGSQRVQRLSEVPVDRNKCPGAGKTGSSRPGRRLQGQLEILPGRCGRALIKETLLTERD